MYDKSFIESLVETIGVEATAERLLLAGSVDVRCEQFLTRYMERLSWRLLFEWLRHPAPDGAEPRPERRIVDRIVETIKESDVMLFFGVPAVVREVHDDGARDALIKGLRARVRMDIWLRVLAPALTTASKVFDAVRDVEVNGDPREVPHVARNGDGSIPYLLAELCDLRGEDDQCLGRLRDRALEGPTRHYALWLLDRSDLLSAGSLETLLGEVPTLSEVDRVERARVQHLAGLAARWLDPDAHRAWVAHRMVRAAECGVPWAQLWWEIEPALRDDVALASLESSCPAPWVLPAIGRHMRGTEAWNRAFALLDRIGVLGDEREPLEALAQGAGRLERTPSSDELTEALHQFAAWSKGDLLEWPFPPDADDSFDERLLALFKAPLRGVTIARRLQELPITPSRARRILDLTLEHGFFWTLKKAEEIAKAAGPVAVDVPLPQPLSAQNIALYRTLTGEDVALRRLGEKFEALVSEGRSYGLWSAIELAAVAPSVLTETRRQALKELAFHQSVAEVGQVARNAEWLVSEPELVTWATSAKRDWGLSTMAARNMPECLAPIMETQAVTESDGEAALPFLAHLEDRFGRPRRHVLRLAVERLKALGPDSVPPAWLGTKLDTGSLWEEPGAEILSLLMASCDEAAVRRVWALCRAADAAPSSNVRLDPAMQTALGGALIDIAERALRDGNHTLARNALTALALIFPASRLRRRVNALRGIRGHETVLSVIEVNENLLRRPEKPEVANIVDVAKALGALLGRELVAGDRPGGAS